MKWISKEQVLSLHSELIADFGGLDGIRDGKMLDSALNAPFQTFEGVDLYPGVIEKAARLGSGLVKNHPFVDGNKRIGTHIMLMFLNLNNISLEYEDDELVTTILSIASGDMDDEKMRKWIEDHIVHE